MEIDAGKLAEAWQATVSARFPPPPQTETADAAPGPDDRQTALRRHLHEGFGQVVAGLRNRVDPRPALAELYRQAIVLGGREDSPESLLIAACADDYNGLLNRLSTGLATVFPFGYPNAPLRQVPMQDTRRAGAEDLDAPAGQQPFDVAVCQGLVPPSIDASALSAAWRECAGRKLPAFPESGPDVSFENRLVREHFHDAVFSAARHLEMGIDPRPALLHFQDQIAGLSASTDHAEFRELFRMCVNYRHILKTARPVERQSS